MQRFEIPGEVYRDLLAITPSPVVVHDAAGRVVAANQAFADLLGYGLDDVDRLDVGQIIHPDDRPRRDRDAEQLLSGAAMRLVGERRLRHAGGHYLTVRVRKATALYDDAPIVLVIIEDATRDQEVIAELRHAVHTDDLTGLLNRRGLWRHLDDLASNDFPQLLALVDVDRLKRTNDGAGHAIGDLLLRTIASRLDGVIGPGAVAARLSGDEFLVLAPAALWPGDSLAQAIRTRVSGTPILLPTGGRLAPSVSVGVTTLTGPEDFTPALGRADGAMYLDKRAHGLEAGA